MVAADELPSAREEEASVASCRDRTCGAELPRCGWSVGKTLPKLCVELDCKPAGCVGAEGSCCCGCTGICEDGGAGGVAGRGGEVGRAGGNDAERCTTELDSPGDDGTERFAHAISLDAGAVAWGTAGGSGPSFGERFGGITGLPSVGAVDAAVTACKQAGRLGTGESNGEGGGGGQLAGGCCSSPAVAGTDCAAADCCHVSACRALPLPLPLPVSVGAHACGEGGRSGRCCGAAW